MSSSQPGGGLGLAAVPVFHPSQEEWVDPLGYISRTVRPGTESWTGLAKIVPPPGWHHGPAIEPARVSLDIQVQSPGLLLLKQASSVARVWRDDYADFCLGRGHAPGRDPVVAGQVVDLFQLYTAVTAAGGWTGMEMERGWAGLAARLEVRGARPGGR